MFFSPTHTLSFLNVAVFFFLLEMQMMEKIETSGETFLKDLVWETETERLADKETKNERKKESSMSCFKSFPHLSFSPLRSLLSFLPPSLFPSIALCLIPPSPPALLPLSLALPPCLHPLPCPSPQPLVKYPPIIAEPGPEGLHMQNAA